MVVAPFLVAAAGFPIGDVALGDGVAEVVERGDDVFVGDAVIEHVIDEVALEFGEAGDDAVAAAAGGKNG